MKLWHRLLLYVAIAYGMIVPWLEKAFAQTQPVADTDSARERFVRTVPPGFEDFAETETITVPVVLNGVKIGEAEATINLTTLTLSDPGRVVALVPDITARAEVIAALSGQLPLRADLACGDAPTARCGQLAPEVAGIIYDRAADRLLLFVNPDLRRFTARLGRIQPTQSEPGLVGGSSLFFSGDGGGRDVSYTLNLNATAGVGHRHVLARGSTSPGRTELDALAYRAVRNGTEVRAGLFESGVSQFRANNRLIGFRLGSTLDDLDNAAAYDTPLVLALTEPARIEVFAGDRLIGSARYPAGSVRIDTSGFPGGAYPIRLRINEGGSVREEERLFSRDSAFPPLGAAQSFVAFGARRAAAGFGSASQERGLEMQLGHRRSFAGGLGFGGALFVREDSAAIEAGAARTFSGGQVSAAVLYSSLGEVAGSAATRVQFGPWRSSFDLRYVQPRRDQADPPHLIGSDRSLQASFSAGRQIGAASLSLFGSWRDSDRGGSSWNAEPSLDLPFRFASASGSVRFSSSLSDTENQTRIELSFRRGAFGGGSLTSRAGLRQGGRGGALAEFGFQNTLRVAASQANVGLRWRTDPGREEIGANSRLSTAVGSVNLDLTQDLNQGRSTYSGSAETGFALTRAGPAFGPNARNDAAIVFVNRSRSEDATTTALVNGARVARLAPQTRRMHGAQGFRALSAALIPADGAAVAGGQRPVEARLFPGTVVLVETELVDIAAVFGRLLDRSGQPISGAWLDSGLANAQTDDGGWFQLDAAAGARVQVRPRGAVACSFALDVTEGAERAKVIPVGDVRCE